MLRDIEVSKSDKLISAKKPAFESEEDGTNAQLNMALGLENDEKKNVS